MNIERLSQDTGEATEAARTVIDLARTAPECRQRAIEQLVSAMNKPKLNLEADRSSFLLWSRGSSILGELKAVEALDLLIDHLNANDGYFSTSMSHQPVVNGVKKMGTLAVPKLSDAIQHNRDRNIRLAAALCLSDIGGTEARKVLTQALATEPESCVKRFIELSLAKPTADVLQERVLAFRCGN